MLLNSIKEYISLFPMAIKNADKIAESIWNTINKDSLTEDELKTIISRKLICEECPYNSKNVTAEDFHTDRLDDHCIHCGCNIDLKVKCLSCRCGIEVYNLKNPTKKLEVRWNIYQQ